jgi:hypothetical protein
MAAVALTSYLIETRADPDAMGLMGTEVSSLASQSVKVPTDTFALIVANIKLCDDSRHRTKH